MGLSRTKLGHMGHLLLERWVLNTRTWVVRVLLAAANIRVLNQWMDRQITKDLYAGALGLVYCVCG